jgi:hypothetical protein
MNDNQNSTETIVVTPNDILYGRGRSKDNHPGNKAFRDIVSKYKLPYFQAKTHQEKRSLVELVVFEIKAQDPPGRFLCNEHNNDSWYEVDDVGKIHKKVSQALREDPSSARRLHRRSSIMSTAVETDPLTHNSMSSREGTSNKEVNIQDTNDNDRILTQDEDKNQKKVPKFTPAQPNIARRGNCLQEHVNLQKVKSHRCVTMSSIESSHTDEVQTNLEEGYDHVSNPFDLTPSSFLFVSSSVNEDEGPQQYASASDESSSGVNKNKKMKRQHGNELMKLTPLPHLEISSSLLSSTTVGLSNLTVGDGVVDDNSAPKMSAAVNKKRKSRTEIKSTSTITTREDKILKVAPQELFPSNLFPFLVEDEKEVQSEQQQGEEQVFLQEELEEEAFILFGNNCWWEEEITSHGYDW